MTGTLSAPLPFLPPLWQGVAHAPALSDGGAWLSYGELAGHIAALQSVLTGKRKCLIFCLIDSTLESAMAYLAAASSGHAIALLDPALPQLPQLITQYQPDFIIAPAATAITPNYKSITWALANTHLWQRELPSETALHPDLFLLLLTSGSTGGSKFVRLSYRNIAANTQDIIASLALSSSVRALLHLPLSYSFGLSVLHMQLAAGGSILLTNKGMMERDFWELARAHAVTLFPGVPYHYTMLTRLGLSRLNVPSLKVFLQAGGRFDPAAAAHFCREVTAQHGQFYIMYGQTEAAPRLTCFAAHLRPEKIGTVGQPLPQVRLTLRDNEIIAHGPNIMMGYCTGSADLALGDTQQGELATGDLGAMGADGFLTITGRKQRFAKLYGVRLALDEIEQVASRIAPAVAVEAADHIIIATTAPDSATQEQIKTALLAATKLQPGWLSIRVLAEFPTRANGKLDYPRLQEMLI